MKCECVVVYIIMVLYCTIFSGSVDRLVQKRLCMLNHASMYKCIMECESCWCMIVYIVKVNSRKIFSGIVYRLDLIGYPNR